MITLKRNRYILNNVENEKDKQTNKSPLYKKK